MATFKAMSDLVADAEDLLEKLGDSAEPKVKELIYVAITSSTTHLFEPGIAVHAQNALEHGATIDEIMEVFQLTSVLGIHTLTVGMPVLMEELERAGIPLTDA